MKKNIDKINTIRIKLAIIVGSCLLAILLLFIIQTYYLTSDRQLKAVKKHSFAMAKGYSKEIKNFLSKASNSTKTLAHILSSLSKEEKENLSRNTVNNMIINVLKKNENFIGMSTAWEPNAFDGKDSLYKNVFPYDYTGRYVPYFYRDNYGTIYKDSLDDYDTQAGVWYWKPREEKKDVVTNPYYYNVGGNRILMLTMSSPILVNNKFLGVVTVDLSLKKIQEKITESKLVKSGITTQIISNNGIYIAHSKRIKRTGQNIGEYNKNVSKILYDINNKIENVLDIGDKVVISVPLVLTKKTAWQIRIELPKNNIKKIDGEISEIIKKELILAIFMIFIFMIFLVWVIQYYMKPLRKIAEGGYGIARGEINYNSVKSKGSEISAINEVFLKVSSSLSEKQKVVEKITQGDYSKKVEIKNETDALGISINKMIEALIKAKEERTKRKVEDKIRNWKNEGSNILSEVLRKNTKNIKEISKEIIVEIVNYLDANQGGLFLLNNLNHNDIYIEQTATYAYNRFRKEKKRIELTEGLIGRCIDDKKIIYITEIPEDYLKITSGLGYEKPTAILIVPLLLNDNTIGAIELASFKNFEKHHREFIVEISEIIASSLGTVKNNMQTELLLVESQEKGRLLAEQEEEMRQNLEEMQTTQEESNRREAEMRGMWDAINFTSLVAEFSMDGTIIQINEAFIELFELEDNDILGKKHSDFAVIENMSKEDYLEFWQDLKDGKSKKITYLVDTGKKQVWLQENYTPILDNEGVPYKILDLAIDISESKQNEDELRKQTTEMKIKEDQLHLNLEEMKKIQAQMAEKDAELRGQFDAINNMNAMVEFDLEGNIKNANETYCKLLEYPKEKLIGKNHSDLKDKYDVKNSEYEKFWDELKTGNTQSGEYTFRTNNNRTIYIRGIYSPIQNANGEIFKILKLAFDITDMKNKEEELLEQTEIMSMQEEMMKQGLMEYEYLQKESEKNTKYLNQMIDALDTSFFIFVISTEGQVIEANTNFLNYFEIKIDELQKMYLKDFAKIAENKQEFDDFWQKLVEGENIKIKSEFNFNNKKLELIQIYTPVIEKDTLDRIIVWSIQKSD